jgi:hypothetical protein
MLEESPTFSTIRTLSCYGGSHKRYLSDSRADLRVNREIVLSHARYSDRTQENPPIPIYDTSGCTPIPRFGLTCLEAWPIFARIGLGNATYGNS